MVGFSTSFYYYEIGSADFLHSFFSTVAYNLEGGHWGEKYPCLMNELYQDELAADKAAQALEELKSIQQGLKNYPVQNVIWDIDDLSKRPPWGDNISSDITDLSNYYFTSDGKDFITVFMNALQKAEELGQPLKIAVM
jgi:hypothetical protein